MKKAVEIAGWIGVILILGAFATNVTEVWSSKNLFYLAANAVGAGLVGWNAFVKKAYPPLFLEVAWFGVAVFGIFKLFA